MYLALIWNKNDTSQDLVATNLKRRFRKSGTDWSTVIDRSGLFLSVRRAGLEINDGILVSPTGNNAILGSIFDRSGDTCCSWPEVLRDGPTEIDDARPLEAVGKRLAERYWGRYVAFLSNHAGSESCVLCDPAGTIPCQHIIIKGISVYFARLQDVDTLEPPRLHVNRHFLIGMLAREAMLTGGTGYTEIETILPGQQSLHRGTQRILSFFWDPTNFIRIGSELDASTAAAEVKRVVSTCVRAWTSLFRTLTLQLSGGLDSTILAACLVECGARDKVVCLNFYKHRETADEREYARLVANYFGLKLHEFESPDQHGIELCGPRIRAVLPTMIPKARNTAEIWRRITGKIEGHFRGDGGDELFHRSLFVPDCADVLYNRGSFLSFLRVALNDAIIREDSLWRTLRLGLKYGYLTSKREDWKQHLLNGRYLLSPEVRKSAADDKSYIHPAYRSVEDCPPGKIEQAKSWLRFLNNFYIKDKDPIDPMYVSPLLSQPLMEFSLATPLHVLRTGRRDRGLIRIAYTNAAPQKVLNRKHKGLNSKLGGDWLTRNLTVAREILCDGYLVREGILARPQLESILSGPVPNAISEDLLAYICVENWVNGNVEEASLEARRTASSETTRLL